MKIALVYKEQVLARAIAQVIGLLGISVVESRDDADLVISEDAGVLLRALKDDQKAIQYLVHGKSQPAIGLRDNPEFTQRFRIVETDHGVPQVPSLFAAIKELEG